MLEQVDFATLLQYSPKGKTEICQKSRLVMNHVKNGDVGLFRKRVSAISKEYEGMLNPFLNENVTLVPAPRSSLIQEGSLWPSLEICKMLASINLGTVAPCLIRREAITKSSLCIPADRPSIMQQYNSMAVKNYVPNQNITLVDDILTLGRTTFAGASRLADKYPNATIRIFAFIRTRSIKDDLEDVLDVQTGMITYNPLTERCSLPD